MRDANLGDGANGLSEADIARLEDASWKNGRKGWLAEIELLLREHTERAWDEVEQVVASRREAFLSSPNLDPAWIAGWHSAVDDVTNSVRAARKEQNR